MMCVGNKQSRSIPQCKEENNMETHLQILQESAKTMSPLIIPKQEVREVENLTFPTLPNPATIKEEIKSEATDHGMSTFSSVAKSFYELNIRIVF